MMWIMDVILMTRFFLSFGTGRSQFNCWNDPDLAVEGCISLCLTALCKLADARDQR